MEAQQDTKALQVSPGAADEAVETTQFLTFDMGTEIYGIEIRRIREIIECQGITTIPLAAEFVRGVINLRGLVVPVIDLLILFGKTQIPIGKRTCIVILDVEIDGNLLPVGLLVDAVREVVDLGPDDMEAAPSFGTGLRAGHIQAMGKIGERFAILLNTDLLLSLNEIFAALQNETAAGTEAAGV